jgi:hypothetical protein
MPNPPRWPVPTRSSACGSPTTLGGTSCKPLQAQDTRISANGQCPRGTRHWTRGRPAAAPSTSCRRSRVRQRTQAKLYTCYAWPARPAEEAAIASYADVLLGIHRGAVVTAYDNLSWRREEDAERTHEVRQGLPRAWPRIVFDGTKSTKWAHLISAPCPAPPPGQWPIRYIDTSTVTRG